MDRPTIEDEAARLLEVVRHAEAQRPGCMYELTRLLIKENPGRVMPGPAPGTWPPHNTNYWLVLEGFDVARQRDALRALRRVLKMPIPRISTTLAALTEGTEQPSEDRSWFAGHLHLQVGELAAAGVRARVENDADTPPLSHVAYIQSLFAGPTA